ncbi:TPA: hypothetical protein ACY4SF_000624 [Clostridium perfringens]|uniref:hypothetical protein n=1 Tax=Clostridium perfringens TaxID=1502 RepID=UPI001CAD5284|nr:hypothetical protein [Clostridium perfringens]EJT5935641.1 hypothetical protein [Clostridium perfringens]ELC8402325.1 hypothetical protein [Clostridium perfringens]MDH5094909.1 hypothetical protein [Clostridium perfringens]MDM0883925.1 hypothetical protein [Clostridium perfringens]MDM1011142.1 hypothetical protein [Clostridium perfringens]
MNKNDLKIMIENGLITNENYEKRGVSIKDFYEISQEIRSNKIDDEFEEAYRSMDKFRREENKKNKIEIIAKDNEQLIYNDKTYKKNGSEYPLTDRLGRGKKEVTHVNSNHKFDIDNLGHKIFYEERIGNVNPEIPIKNENICELLIKSGFKTDLFYYMNVKESQGGAVYFPLLETGKLKISETNSDNLTSSSTLIQGGKVNYIEKKSRPIISEVEFDDMVIINNTKEVNEAIKNDIINQMIDKVSLSRLAVELNKIKALEIEGLNNNIEKVDYLISEYDSNYLDSDVFVCMNETQYKAINKIRLANGVKIVNIVNGFPYIEGFKIVVIPDLVNITMLSAKCLGMVIGKLNEGINGHDSQEKRRGIQAYGRIISNDFVIIDPSGIRSISLT